MARFKANKDRSTRRSRECLPLLCYVALVGCSLMDIPDNISRRDGDGDVDVERDSDVDVERDGGSSDAGDPDDERDGGEPGPGGGSDLDGAIGSGDAAPDDASEMDGGGTGASDASDASGGQDGSVAQPDGNVPPGSDACTAPMSFYPDQDQDGYGVTSSGVSACERPPGSWATRGGDCEDGNDLVHPNQPAYFEAPYATGGGLSYDYDCFGGESAAPGLPGAAPNCSLLGDCERVGYRSTNRSNGNPLCGSTTLVKCVTALGGLLCGSEREEPNSTPYACH